MPKGIQTGSYSVPETVKGASYAQVPSVNMSARGDSPAKPMAAGTQGFRGAAENIKGYWTKATAFISKLGPQS